ncbi:hypothetical protein BV20DRAFT_997411, partial [Pilatotrama ljubarskyi]
MRSFCTASAIPSLCFPYRPCAHGPQQSPARRYAPVASRDSQPGPHPARSGTSSLLHICRRVLGLHCQERRTSIPGLASDAYERHRKRINTSLV